MIEVNHITKRFGKVTAVDDFTLDINRGSVLGIVGSNGGGKSTLLRILSGVFDADSGEVKINGQNIYNNPSVKGECFFIPDFPYFSNSATLENTAYLYRSLYPNWNENAFRQFCSVFPIDPNAKIIDMSKGMQRQAALILAISTCPRYLLLDEIFDGLDPVVRRLVKKILIDNVSANDMTVVIASHNLRELEELCDRICLIHKGKLLLEREIDEIKLGPRKVQVAFTEVPDNSFFEEINVINLWRNGNIFNLTIRGTEDEFMPKLEEHKPLYISAVPMTLEEIFISEMGAAGYDAENII
jgi:ABC-2 type transport system ATP-binding protein